MILSVGVGGTFTALLLADPKIGRFEIAKVPPTPTDQSDRFMAGIQALDADPRTLDTVIHGTTVGANAVLKQKDVRCGLITTRGFRDTLEFGRRTRPNQWGMSGRFEPLVPGDRRIEVTGGSGAGHDAPAEREAYGGIECLG